MEEKIDTLLKNFEALKQAQEQNRRDLSVKLDRLEKEVAAGQEETAQLVVKRIKRDSTQPQFQRKGNEKQFTFNAEVNDSIQAAVGLLDKLKPEQSQAAAILKSAKEQLQEGSKAIAEWQKLIRFADRSEYGWGAVEEDLASNEKDAKKWADAEKYVEQKRCQKRTQSDRDVRPQLTPPQFLSRRPTAAYIESLTSMLKVNCFSFPFRLNRG